MTGLTMTPTGPVLTYHPLQVAPSGLSTEVQAELTDFAVGSVGGQAAPTFVHGVPGSFTNVSFLVLPIGWIGEWHPSRIRQWVVALRGRWFIEAQDGTRIEMGAGDLHWGADQVTAEVNGGHGHRSGQCGDEPCVLMMTQNSP